MCARVCSCQFSNPNCVEHQPFLTPQRRRGEGSARLLHVSQRVACTQRLSPLQQLITAPGVSSITMRNVFIAVRRGVQEAPVDEMETDVDGGDDTFAAARRAWPILTLLNATVAALESSGGAAAAASVSRAQVDVTLRFATSQADTNSCPPE